MKRLFKRNRHWTTEDKLLAGAGVAAAVGIFLVMKQKRDDAVAVATSGMRGIGAYFVDPVNLAISGLGAVNQSQELTALFLKAHGWVPVRDRWRNSKMHLGGLYSTQAAISLTRMWLAHGQAA